MAANIGQTDKIIRLLAGAVLLALAFLKLGGLATTAGIVAAVVGAVLIVTALINFCPAYGLLGLRTNKKSSVSE